MNRNAVSKKKTQPTLFQKNGRYVLVTGESPPGFESALYIVWEGNTPDNLKEAVQTTDQLRVLAGSQVELTSLPAEWRTAFNSATGLSLPEPQPPPQPQLQPRQAAPPAPPPPPEKPDPFVQWGPLCVTWVWAFGIATLTATLLGIVRW